MSPFVRTRGLSVSRLGESRLIERIRRWLGKTNPAAPAGIGDDCAVFRSSGTKQVITVDAVVFDRHFDASVHPRDAGSKLVKRNLSDIAAMGARPTVAVVSLALDARVSIQWLEHFYRGMASACRQYSVKIVGGDVTGADGVFVASLTLLGDVSGKRLLTRTGARIGDFIYVTGRLGGTRRLHHFRFKPRLQEGSWLASRPSVQSMMDLSDGLAKDIHALTPAGGKPSIRLDVLPVSKEARALGELTHRDPAFHALTDGEDYELLFTVAKDTNRLHFVREWKKHFKTKLTCIGEFVNAGSVPSGEIDFGKVAGYEHFC